MQNFRVHHFRPGQNKCKERKKSFQFKQQTEFNGDKDYWPDFEFKSQIHDKFQLQNNDLNL